MAIRKLKSVSGEYSEILEINCKMRFYWDKDGKFDGIETGPYPKDMTQYQHKLMNHLFDRLTDAFPDLKPIEVPDVWKKDFGERL